MREDVIKIIIVHDDGNIESVFTNLQDIYEIEVKQYNQKYMTGQECIDLNTELRSQYREV